MQQPYGELQSRHVFESQDEGGHELVCLLSSLIRSDAAVVNVEGAFLIV